MSDRIFIQKSRIGLKIFHLKNDVLEVCSRWQGRDKTKQIALGTIRGDYQRVARRFTALILVPFVLCVLFLWGGLALMIHGKDLQILSMYPFFIAAYLLVLTLHGVPRVDMFQFFDHWGKPAFFVVREKKQAQECDDFIQELLSRLERIEANQEIVDEVEGRVESAVQVPAPDEDGYIFSGEYRWKISIVTGAFSASLPWVCTISGLLDESPFIVVFFGAVTGIGFCVLSYQAKERLRHLSLIGAVLSMIAPLF